jgi:putative transposase
MKAHEEDHRVAAMAEVLGVSRSGYYRYRTGWRSARSLEDEQLTEKIVEIHQDSRRTYGSPRITMALKKEQLHTGKNRVARLMRQAGLRGVSRQPKTVRTTRTDPKLPIAANLLKNRQADGPNQIWVTDITYIGTDEGWGYLAAVLDIFSRKIVGWAFKTHMESSLVCQALQSALRSRRPAPGLILHSDRGSQYASLEYRRMLQANHFVQSMSGRGNCYDNATMESFFGTLKNEQIYRRIYHSFTEARADIFDFIETFYNPRRMHTSLDGCSPDEFERGKSSSPRGEEHPDPQRRVCLEQITTLT